MLTVVDDGGKGGWRVYAPFTRKRVRRSWGSEVLKSAGGFLRCLPAAVSGLHGGERAGLALSRTRSRGKASVELAPAICKRFAAAVCTSASAGIAEILSSHRRFCPVNRHCNCVPILLPSTGCGQRLSIGGHPLDRSAILASETPSRTAAFASMVTRSH